MAGRQIRIGLLWHSPNSGNLGVGALTVANIALAREAATALGLEPTFVLMGMREEGTCAYVGEEEAEVFAIDGRRLLSPAGFWRSLGDLDCVLDVGGGDSFAEIYGPKRFFFLWWSKVLTLARPRPLLLSPQTIGPFTRSPYRQLAREVLTRAARVMTRDNASLQALQKLAPKARGVLSADVAFALPYEDRSALRGGEVIRVGVNVSGLLDHEARSGRNRFGLQADYSQLMRRCIAELSAAKGAQVHLVSHVTGEGADNDEPAARALSEQFPNAVLAPRFASPGDAKSYISSLDFLVAARMHACIAAISSGVPTVPIAYSRKFTGLFEMLGYPWTLPVTGFDTDAAVGFIMERFEHRVELAADADAATAKAHELLDAYRAELRCFLAEAAS